MSKKRATAKTATSKSKRGVHSKSRKAAPKRQSGKVAYDFEARLREAVSTVNAADAVTMPIERAIESILRLAAQSLNSGEASVLVRDGTGGGLKFMVAIGTVADQLMEVTLPPGKGIAGFVFASGQPMVVADASQEMAFYPEIDRATGYETQSILATPLQVNGETIGVLEFVNRLNGPPHAPFTPEEMDQAANFANVIAPLVDAHGTAGLIESLFKHLVKNASAPSEKQNARQTNDELQRWLKKINTAPEHRELVSLAVLLRTIVDRGEAERRLCREMLEALARWTSAKQTLSGNAVYFA